MRSVNEISQRGLLVAYLKGKTLRCAEKKIHHREKKKNNRMDREDIPVGNKDALEAFEVVGFGFELLERLRFFAGDEADQGKDEGQDYIAPGGEGQDEGEEIENAVEDENRRDDREKGEMERGNPEMEHLEAREFEAAHHQVADHHHNAGEDDRPVLIREIDPLPDDRREEEEVGRYGCSRGCGNRKPRKVFFLSRLHFGVPLRLGGFHIKADEAQDAAERKDHGSGGGEERENGSLLER